MAVPRRYPIARLCSMASGGIALLCAAPALAAAEGAPHLDGAELGMISVVPFAGILLSIAICPLVLPNFWHRHFGKISAIWAVSFLIPFAITFGLPIYY